MHDKTEQPPPLFNLIAGLEARDRGIELAAENNSTLVVEAREIAVEHCRKFGKVTADDVWEGMMKRGYGRHTMGNSMAGVFKDRRFRNTGNRVKSRRAWAHANLICEYVLVSK